jgi:hypothetical protein
LRLIPLYAIGVFLSFTLSRGGHGRRWWKIGHLEPGEEVKEPGSVLRYEPSWRLRMVVNGFGSVATAIVAVVFATTKFKEGAWIVLILTPLLVTLFFGIHRHYKGVARRLTLVGFPGLPQRRVRHRVIMPISGVHQGTLHGLRYARLLSDDVTAVHVSMDAAETEKLKAKWSTWGRRPAGDRGFAVPHVCGTAVEVPAADPGCAAAQRGDHHRRAAVHSRETLAQCAAHAHGRPAAR